MLDIFNSNNKGKKPPEVRRPGCKNLWVIIVGLTSHNKDFVVMTTQVLA